ncbi:fungal-specific transcription factor domain protein [Aspergillus steynii IBT 23096]|uniref:Fungal-specific transcription factor domain protein n=1 Tax=Aspergillus steynii IBT 23096 TaxID=1392250 RepID=A0A2I2FZ10_9EURO|nr:fungal-specific transcription factor domain protein [Aspergillus steynii IBT 23096]PLB45786.1 fungal-specific transcription factor domain protein [Aspergillus steynii IBT 23096]
MSRPYRSKRHRPCDQCRERKLGCQTDDGLPCIRCRSADIACTFDHPPPKRPRRESSQSSWLWDEVTPDDLQPSTQPLEQQQPPPIGQTFSLDDLPVDGVSPAVSGQLVFGRSPTQFVQSLDQLQGFSAQLFGASAESDPWLLRHCSFDDAGVKCFYKVHFRNAGGVPTAEKIPVHFMIAADELADSAKRETSCRLPADGSTSSSSTSSRDELNRLVPPEYGPRLVALFVKYVYPALPLLSRSHMGLTPSCWTPQPWVLERTPVHLLAAIYASALPFAAHDDYLCVLQTYSAPPAHRLWRLVYELVAEEIHTPHLAVLQAAVLYLHRPLDDAQASRADTPFVWSWVGSLVGLAESLGLHIECRMWGIPAWEKRLRRRLWWAVYAEDKWRSLLLGRPPYIHAGEWDVAELDDADFLYHARGTASAASAGVTGTLDPVPFRYLVDLSAIAEQIYSSFYTLRKSQYLSERFHASHDIGRPLLERLNAWYSSLPESFRLPNWSKSVSGLAPYPTSIHFAYMILVLFVYRALLRPMARSSSPPLIFDLEEMPTNPDPDPAANPELDASADVNADAAVDTEGDNPPLLDCFDMPEIESFPAVDLTDHGTGETILNAAERCASIMVSFTRRLTSSDFVGFWYSWSRISFATVSNFLLLLLIQAPNADRALKGKQLVESWLRVLRCQSQSFPMMKLGLTRLDAVHWVGLEQTFVLPGHVAEVIQNRAVPTT